MRAGRVPPCAAGLFLCASVFFTVDGFRLFDPAFFVGPLAGEEYGRVPVYHESPALRSEVDGLLVLVGDEAQDSAMAKIFLGRYQEQSVKFPPPAHRLGAFPSPDKTVPGVLGNVLFVVASGYQ